MTGHSESYSAPQPGPDPGAAIEGAPIPSPATGIVNPRLSDGFGLTIRQDEVDFVIPHLREDLPLYLDPFLLWKSGDPQYQTLHGELLRFVEAVRGHAVAGRTTQARLLLSEVSEPFELGLGHAAGTKHGSALGPATIASVINTFQAVPQLHAEGLDHLETLALLVPRVAEDRISDVTASVLKRWLADFTEQSCVQWGIPLSRQRMIGWDATSAQWRPFEANLPSNPIDGSPILLAPLDLLRRLPWINYDDYYRSTYAPLVLPPGRNNKVIDKREVLAYNHAHYNVVRDYLADRQANADACKPDPLFQALSLTTLRRKIKQIRGLPTGRDGGADKKFEALAFDVLTSLLHPELDLADNQVRTIDGVHIRDIIFHNDAKTGFLTDLRMLYQARQPVFELKNVVKLDTEHVNQLYRYLDTEEMGLFGVLVARTPPPANVQRNIIDLWSSKRAAILCLDDSDLELMLELLVSGRRPIEAIRKKHVEFTRQHPK